MNEVLSNPNVGINNAIERGRQEAEADIGVQTTKGDGGWTLALLDQMFKDQAKRYDEELGALQQKLGAPDLFVTGIDENDFGYGLWHVEGGVLKIQKRKNGYHWCDRVIYTECDVDSLFQCLTKFPVRK